MIQVNRFGIKIKSVNSNRFRLRFTHLNNQIPPSSPNFSTNSHQTRFLNSVINHQYHRFSSSPQEFQQLNKSMESDRRISPESDTLVVKADLVQDHNHPDTVFVKTEEVSTSNLSQNPNSEAENAKSASMEGNRVLPEEISGGVVILECDSSAEGGSCTVHLVGTAHVSKASCEQVQAVVSYLKPQVVFLELCSSRSPMLFPQNLRVPTMKEMFDLWKKKKNNTFGIVYSWFLAKVASKLEVFPGSEFRVAFEEARKYGGEVILGDRPVQITLRRTWAKMSMWHKVKFIFGMVFQSIFLPSPKALTKMLKDMDDADMLTVMTREMSKKFPTVMETLVHERDLYMTSCLLRVASEHTSVVAVVGRGHLPGITKHWKEPIETKHLLEIPTKTPMFSVKRVLKFGVVAGVAVVSSIYLGRKM